MLMFLSYSVAVTSLQICTGQEQLPPTAEGDTLIVSFTMSRINLRCWLGQNSPFHYPKSIG